MSENIEREARDKILTCPRVRRYLKKKGIKLEWN